MIRVLLTVVIAAWLPGCALVGDSCGDCGACPPALVLNVVDAETGEPVHAVQVSGDVPAAECGDVCTCDGTCAFGHEPGTFRLVVEAAGYETQEVSVVVPESRDDGCCACPAFETTQEVRLEPLV